MSRQILTVRCTTIESFREWINCEYPEDKFWVSEANVIGNIKGTYRYNVKAAYGTAGHSIIEEAPLYTVEGGYKVDDFTFTDHQAAPLIKFRNDHPLMTRELALSKFYHTPHFDIIITGTCDHMEGNVMRDTKFKFSSFDVEDFIKSFQHRCYLDMAGMDRFVYDFFRVAAFETIEDCGKARISDVESMPVNRYPAMEADIQEVLNEFADFVTFKNLQEYLTITPAKRKRIAKGDPKLLKLI